MGYRYGKALRFLIGFVTRTTILFLKNIQATPLKGCHSQDRGGANEIYGNNVSYTETGLFILES